MKKLPKCIYGHGSFSVCVNPLCSMPAFMCEIGSKQFDQCGSFHQKCQRIIWTDIENVINRNPWKKQEQFQALLEKFDQMFESIIKAIQVQHLKFKTWISTYGFNIEIMKFIKNVNDENTKFIDGKFMDKIMHKLFENQKNTIEAPKIKDFIFNAYFDKLKDQIESLSDLYLKIPSEQQINNVKKLSSKSMNATKKKEEGNGLIELIQKKVDSVIIKDLNSIKQFFDDGIKNFKLLYRASNVYFSINQFHNRCDDIANTLTLVENQFGKVLGGYTPLIWSKNKVNWTCDKEQKTFIFSLDLKEKFKLILPQFAIANNTGRGPIFGCCDLFISDNADKEKSGCEFPISFNNGKYLRKPETTEIFTGTKSGKFLIKEWEVFEIEFEE